jgi:hypothetical protein
MDGGDQLLGCLAALVLLALVLLIPATILFYGWNIVLVSFVHIRKIGFWETYLSVLAIGTLVKLIKG